jgi:serine carboxypeptidase-like clade 1
VRASPVQIVPYSAAVFVILQGSAAEFFKAYPELAKNEFYFSGESYAGVLVPTVALQILQHKTDANKALAPHNLGGFAIGNDCPGNQIYTCTPYSGWRGVKVAIDFRFGHGMVPEPLYKEIYAACSGWWDDEPFPHGKSSTMFDPPPSKCAELLEDPVRPCKSIAGDTYQMGGGYFLYDTCSEDMMALSEEDHLPHPEEAGEQREMEAGRRGRQLQAPPTSTEFAMTSGEYACGQEHATQVYLNLPAVQPAMNVKLVGKPIFSFSTGLRYAKTLGSLLDDYKRILIPNLRIMQYSGDADPCVPYVGTQRWIDSLGLPTQSPWRPWTTNNFISGYTTVYAGPGVGSNFSFTTIRDAGHMAPRYKPSETLHMITRFLEKQPM